MNVSPAALLQRARGGRGAKAVRYAMVSVVGVALTQVVLTVCHAGFGWSPTASNFTAVTVASVPAYLLNRYWVWGKRGRNHLTKEVLPFWGFALAGLVFSTLLVAQAARWWDSPLAVNLANITAFGLLWVLKFFVLDTLMFGPHHHPELDPDELVEDEPAPAEGLRQPVR